MNPVMDQKNKCDGSYSIAISQMLSEYFCINHKEHKLNKLSAQELISCDRYNMGCNGGNLTTSFNYITRHGLSSEKCMTYKGIDMKCEKKCDDGKNNKVFNFCYMNEEEQLMRYIMKHGPIVAMIPVYTDFLAYKEGVYQIGKSRVYFSNHIAVKIIGWGEQESENEGEENIKYWIIQNSWGETWGEKGYAKILKNQGWSFDNVGFMVDTSLDEEVFKK